MPELPRLGRLAVLILSCLLVSASVAYAGSAPVGVPGAGSGGAGAPNPFRIWETEMQRHGNEKKHPATGVGSCTLVDTDPEESAGQAHANYLKTGQINYVPDGYDCYGAKFAKFGVEFRRFPQPKDFRISNRTIRTERRACAEGAFCQDFRAHALAPAASVNPLAPYFPPFTHVVIIYHENHTFDDYLGDCTTIYSGCNGVVESTNHISSVPDLHKLASTYALDDAYSTGTQPPSGPNHWWLFSGQSSTTAQQQPWPSTGTVFDRFLHGSGSGGDTSFLVNGDIYWMANNVTCSGSRDPSSPSDDQSQTVSTSGGNGYYEPTGGSPSALPVDEPGTTYPDELHYSEYTCSNISVGDDVVANDFLNSVAAHGLPTYSYVELFNDHPGTAQNIPLNDSSAYNIVNTILGNSAYANNTLIIDTIDDTQNGNNGPDHVSNTYRVPLVVMCGSQYCKQHYLSHVAYSTSNVIAAIERVVNNVHPGAIDPNDNLGPNTFPMTSADQSALGDPLEDFWVQGSTPLSASTTASPTSGNAPLSVAFTGSATGGTGPYSYSWNFGDGSAVSTTQNPSHSYGAAGSYTATLTVTDSASPAHTATSTQTITVSNSTSPLSATASGNPTSGQIPLTTNFTGSAAGGTPPYAYSWNFGDSGSSSNASTSQNPSHTYNNVGNYTATLTVTDSASPAHTATSTVAVAADPVASTPPTAPTGLTASPGTNQVTLSWTAPSSTGGQTLTAYTVYRGTASGSETKLTAGGCSGLSGTTLSCTDTGLTAGTTYYYTMTASNPTGESAHSNEASATPTAPSSCTPSTQLIGDPGFESGGTSSPWTASSGVFNNSSSEPPRSGSWDAWMDGYGTTHTDTLSQPVTIPAGCATATMTFWMHIDTAETSTTAKNDTLSLQVLGTGATVLKTLYTYSNLNANTGYSQHTFDMSAYLGQTITVKFTGTENSSLQTSFVLDDFVLSTSGTSGSNTVTVTNPGSQTATVGTAITPLQIQAADSASGQTLTYTATGLPPGLSISSSGQITGTPTTAGTSSVTVKATDTTGASGSTTFSWTVSPASGGCTAAQLLGDPGFESGGSGSAWTVTSTLSGAVLFNNSSAEPPHSGSWDLWLDGYGKSETDTASQSVTIPAACANATLTFWLHIDTAETTTTTKYDTLKLDILNSAGTVLSTPGTWSNLDHNTGYKQWSVNLGSYIGQTIKLRFTGTEDSIDQTSFVLDDTALNVS